MNKLYILAGIIAVQCITITNAAEKKDRHTTRLILYRLVQQNPIDWPAIFTALDNSRDPIDVNTFIIPMDKSTLLEESIYNNNIPAAEILMQQYNANPNQIKDETKLTPMMLACLKGDYKMVESLLNNGGNPNLVSRMGKNCFDLAVKHPAVLELLEPYRAK